jgi:hemerythrin superfamily protein
MNAIDLLTEDHRMLEELFDALELANDGMQRDALFSQLADALAVHATVEEQIFYPACKSADTADELLEALEEHLAAKRLIADLMAMDPDDDVFMAKVCVLKESIQHHVHEEERDLFPRVQRLLGDDMLLAIGNQMAVRRDALEAEGAPRNHIPDQTAHAPAL